MMATMLKSFGLDPKTIQTQAKAALALVESINEQLKLIAEQNRLIIEQNQITHQLINQEKPHEDHGSKRQGHNGGTPFTCGNCGTSVDDIADECRGCGQRGGYYPDKRPV
jgi:hypothetical protein